MSKPIEPGCLAEIVNSFPENNGRRVLVLRKSIGHGLIVKNPLDADIWEVDTPIAARRGYGLSETAQYMNLIPERYLRRIDNDGEQASTWDALADIWQPNTIAKSEKVKI